MNLPFLISIIFTAIAKMTLKILLKSPLRGQELKIRGVCPKNEELERWVIFQGLIFDF